MISDKIGVEVSRIRLFFSGAELLDDRGMNDYEIEPDSVIRLHINPKTSIYASTNQGSAPKVTELLPNRGPTHGGQKIRIQGENFPRSIGWVCKFGSALVPLIYISEHMLECITPAHAPGTVPVEVSHNGTHFTNNNVIFTFMSTSAWQTLIAVPTCSAVGSTLKGTTDSCRTITPIQRHDDRGGNL